jgi:hypothetical protein
VTTRIVTNLPASVQARLLKIAHAQQIDFQLLLNRYIIERFLYRLSRSPERDKFALKGAMLFALWVPRLYRATRDLDLLGEGSDDVDQMVRRVAAICRTDVEEDGVTFQAEGLDGERIRAEEEYVGIRLHLPASVGRARTRIQIDIGLGDAAPGAHDADYPTYLNFPAPRLRVYSREGSIAEKFEAMVTLGMTNSRMKDFFDIWVLSRAFAYDGTVLGSAIRQTFARRGRQIPAVAPLGLTREFAGGDTQQQRWKGFLKRAAIPEPHPTCESVVGSVEAFLMPVASALAGGRRVPAFWRPGGPWMEQGEGA